MAKDFEKTMDAWADHETASAPEMSPTPEMYRMVRARRGKPSALTYRRWAALGAAVATLFIVVVLSAVLLNRRGGVQSAYVKQREGFGDKKGAVVVATPRGKGPQRGPVCLGQLAFQYQRAGSSVIEAIDLLAPSPGTVALTSEDNYRLRLEPLRACYAYVFQQTPTGDLVRLSPDEAFDAFHNPLAREQVVFMPSDPNWLYVEGPTGLHRLYVVASTNPVTALSDIYATYVQARGSQKAQALADLVDALNTQGTERWTFTFELR